MKLSLIALLSFIVLGVAVFASAAQAGVPKVFYGSCPAWAAGKIAPEPAAGPAGPKGTLMDCVFVGPNSPTLFGWVKLSDL